MSAFVAIGVGADLSMARHVAAVAAAQPDVWAAVGVHPHDATSLDAVAEEELESLARQARVVAVGEIGLDYHYMHSPREVQHETFRRLVRLARRVHKPIVIHTREAAEDTLRILDEEGAREVGWRHPPALRGPPLRRPRAGSGFDLSFSGSVTFRARGPSRSGTWARRAILVETAEPYWRDRCAGSGSPRRGHTGAGWRSCEGETVDRGGAAHE